MIVVAGVAALVVDVGSRIVNDQGRGDHWDFGAYDCRP